TEEMTSRIEAIVRERVPELKFIRSRIGSGGFFGGGGRSGSHAATVSLELVGVDERERSSEEISASLRGALDRIPGIRYRMSGSSGMRLLSMGGGEAISVEIFGHDLDQALDIAQRVHDIIQATPGAVDPHISLEKSKPEMQMRIDRKRVADVGLSGAAVSQAVQGYIQGATAGMFREGGDEYPITVRLRERDRRNLEDILSIPLVTPTGQKVTLRTVADFELAAGPTSISRKEQERMVSVTANYTGRDLGAVTRAIEERTDALVLPSGLDIRMGGEVKEQRESFFWLGLALIGAVFLVYAVMASQFESLLDPFIILFTVPLALIGVVWFYFFTNTTINIIGLIGVILLVGIIVNNGIVLVDYMNLLRARGYSLFDAVVQGGRDRLRPVLMTAVTTIVGLVPMSLGIGDGAEFQAPLARAVVGGLTAGTFLTLIFIPVLYSIFESLSARVKGHEKTGHGAL
ncbi:MAG: AcrB/AcrD/AcrF family protein, partial [Chitinivibrionales bacterium]|nr:AcrB/AcrD/AcrF family protein [Chitinivibrionales bacterium]